jgi:hypothetical protein
VISAAVALSFAVLCGSKRNPSSAEDIRGYQPPEVEVMTEEEIYFGVKNYD